ncbi:MAG: trigger factor [Lachnospiraceae bacterium]|nr:trigger factor [Lachnospiraceae bacterium]
MKKRVVSLLMCMMLTLSMAACGSKTEEAESTVEKSVEDAESTAAGSEAAEDTEDENPVLDKEDYTLDECIQLGEYKGLEFTKTVKPVTEGQILLKIQQLTGMQGEELDDPDAVVQEGDTAVIDYEGKKDGVPFEGGTSQEPYGLVIGSGSFIPGFEDGVIGMKAGEERDIPLTFPEEYPAPDLAGQDVVFTVKLHSIERLVIDDKWVKENASEDYANAKEYMDANRKILEEQNEANAQNALYVDAWEKLMSSSTFIALPKKMVDKGAEDYETMMKQQADMYGYSPEDVIKTIGEETYNKEKKGFAINVAKENLLLEAFMKAEGITKDGEEYKKGLEDMVKDAGAESAEELIQAYGQEQIDEILLKTIVVERVISYGTVTEA